jgi:hypothetical protein
MAARLHLVLVAEHGRAATTTVYMSVAVHMCLLELLNIDRGKNFTSTTLSPPQ